MAFDDDGARKIREYRRRFLPEEQGGHPLGSILYVVQLEPEKTPERIKLGITNSMPARLSDYRTACPNAHPLHSWSCDRAWEVAAIRAITNHPSIEHVGGEVFDASDLDVVKDRGDAFFRMVA